MKNKFSIKSLRILGALSLLLVSQSCKDLLQEVVVSSISTDYINTTAGFNAGVNAAYSSLRVFYGTEEGLTMTEFGTDLYRAGADGSYKGFHFYDSQLNSYIGSSGTPLQTVWDEPPVFVVILWKIYFSFFYIFRVVNGLIR